MPHEHSQGASRLSYSCRVGFYSKFQGSHLQGRAYTGGPWMSSWKRVREGWDQFTGDLSGLKSYFSGEPSNESQSSRSESGLDGISLASKPRQLPKETPNQLETVWLPHKCSCRDSAGSHPTARALLLLSPTARPSTWGLSEPQKAFRCPAAAAIHGFPSGRVYRL